MVDQVCGQVVAVLRCRGRVNVVIVVSQFGVELVGFGAEKSVEAVEALLQRPVVEGACGGGVLDGVEVPLADGAGGVMIGAEQFGDGGGAAGDAGALVWEAAVEVGDGAHADGVRVAPGEQRGAGGRAHRGDVEVGEAQPAGGERVDVGGGDGRAVAAEVRVAEIVQQDDHDVGPVAVIGRLGPPGGRLAERPPDPPAECFRSRHCSAFPLVRCCRLRLGERPRGQPKTAGLTMAGGSRPSRTLIRFSTAISRIRRRVSSVAVPM